tara:strand:- start:6192 stop:7187 length:996 start_codon:yes stop_codon:yes gene_type:complete
LSEYKAYEVVEISDKKYQGGVVTKNVDDLPPGEVLVEVHYSSLNYKDALSANGNKGVTRHFPHVPGIDAVGTVLAAEGTDFSEGQAVLITGYDLGMNTAGGFGQLIRVPVSWVAKLPAGMDPATSMRLGTAGLTAGLCVDTLLKNGLEIDQGEVLVTGATGGVGIIAVSILAKLGFQVTASTGKPEAEGILKAMGASEILDRNEFSNSSPKPLLSERWAAAVDVVGGDTLFNVIKGLKYGGSVAACGLVQSPMFQASVLPFILRGVNLLGVDSVELPLIQKERIWKKLANEWKIETLDQVCSEIRLEQLEDSLATVLSGAAVGRFILNLRS